MKTAKKTLWGYYLYPWIVCLTAALFYAYDFFLRIAPSVMVHPLMHSFGLDAATIGILSACYYYAYTPLQIPSGIIVDRFNVQLILILSILLCVLGSFLFAHVNHLPVLYLARAMMGIGSAFAFIATLKLGARWLPKRQFALFVGIATALGTIGAVAADWILPYLVKTTSWRNAMNVTSYIGVAVAILVIICVRDMPPWLKNAHIPKTNWKKSFLRLIYIIKKPAFWFNGTIGCVLFLPVNVFASLWGVAFLISGRHFTPIHAAAITSLIFIGAAIGAPIAGWFSDFIKSRRTPLVIGTILVLVITITLIYVNNLSHSFIYALLFLLGFFTGPQALVFTIIREINPPHSTGVSTAATNFLVTIGAAIFQPVIGYLLDLSWDGSKTATGIPIFNINDYKAAFLVLPVLTIISFVLIYKIPQTHCKSLYETPENFDHLPEEKIPPSHL